MDFFLCLLLIAFFFLHSRLSHRILQCEQSLEQIKKALLKEKHATQDSPLQHPPLPPTQEQPLNQLAPPEIIPTKQLQQTQIKPPIIEHPIKPAEEPLPSIPKGFQKEEIEKFFDKWSQALSTIKENWMGIFGSLAIVIGTVFFGLTSQIMQYPQVRVATMLFASFVVLLISRKMKGKEFWFSMSGWLKSIAGTVILFATLGAGGIEGLKFIDSPLYALVFLCIGVAINLFISTTASSQAVASLHVILSILALCIVPQSIILLPIGAVVTIIGLLAAYRSNWNIHLLLIVLAFAIQNTVLTLTLGQELLPWMHQIAIASSVAVGLIAGLIRYSKKYESSTIEGWAFAAHIANWGLLSWNIWLHASFLKPTPFILASIAIGGFLLARIAKKRNILWLYYTDTILAQFVAMLAIVWLGIFSINLLDLGLLLLVETIVFIGISALMKEEVLSRAGYFFQMLGCLVMMSFIAATFKTASDYNGMNFLRLELYVALIWGLHLFASWKNLPIDDLKWIFLADKKIDNPLSITVILGTFIFFISYMLGIDYWYVQCWTFLAVGGLGIWRKRKEDQTWNIILVASLAFLHLFNWTILLLLLSKDSSFSLLSRIDSAGIVLLDLLLIFGNFLCFKIWKKNLHPFLIYALGIQLGLLTYLITEPISLLLPGPVFLGFSLILLEGARFISNSHFYCEEIKEKMKESMIHVGIAFLFGFLVRFILVNLQIDPIWHGFSLRLLTEILGLCTFLYWLAFYPIKTSSAISQFIEKWLVEICLGFITLCIVVEMPEMWRPLSWVLMAIGLLLGTLHYNWRKRLFLYSWGYFIASILHVAFVTSTLNMPYLFIFERFYFPAMLGIVLQFAYAFLVQKTKQAILISIEKEESRKKLGTLISSIYRLSPLSIILPAFLGVALLFAFNFEKAILTLLWVGLICIYVCTGLFIKSKRSIQIAMLALLFCSIRLIAFDLVQSNLAIRSLVFIGVGVLMLGISFLYKKYKYRIEDHEEV